MVNAIILDTKILRYDYEYEAVSMDLFQRILPASSSELSSVSPNTDAIVSIKHCRDKIPKGNEKEGQRENRRRSLTSAFRFQSGNS